MPAYIAEQYLGDGVYGAVDQGMIRLRTTREAGEHIVYLEPEVYRELVRMAQGLGWRTPSDSPPSDPSLNLGDQE
jgi:hypothetical protein